jgi:hypothetical protein
VRVTVHPTEILGTPPSPRHCIQTAEDISAVTRTFLNVTYQHIPDTVKRLVCLQVQVLIRSKLVKESRHPSVGIYA